MSNSQVSTLESKPAQRGPAAGAAPTAGAQKIMGAKHDVALSGKKAQITIHAGQDEVGQEPAFVGLNGFAYQIPRDTLVEIPIEVLSILENAVTEIVSTGKDGAVKTRNAPRYAYTVHSIDKLN